MNSLFRWSPKRWISLFGTGCAVVGLALSAQAGPFDAPPAGPDAERAHKWPRGDADAAPEKEEQQFRLNYFNTNWESVIKSFAKETGSELIMDKVPPGKFTRRDRTQYTRHEAVNIFNRELEPAGFRLSEHGKYLIVLDLDQLRTRYRRPVMSQETGTSSAIPPRVTEIPSHSEYYPRRFTGVDVARKRARPQTASARRAIQQVSHEIPVAKTAPSPQLQLTVGTKSSSLEIARFLHESFGAESKTVDSGPDGLPAFRVSRKPEAPGEQPVDVEVGIDIVRNRLVVDAPQQAATQLKALIGLVDRTAQERLDAQKKMESLRSLPAQQDVAREAEELLPTMRILPSHQNVAQVAEELQPTMRRLLALAQPPAGAAQTPAAPSAPQGGVQAAPNLRGEVTVYPVPELNALVVTGPQRDVDAVIKVIKQIEELSTGTTPSIDYILLENVDSSQLATMLESVYTNLLARRTTVTAPGVTQPTTSRASVSIIPVSKPNALLVIAPQKEFAAIEELVAKLDIPVDPQTQFEVFHLKAAISSQVRQLVDDFFADRTDLGGSVSVYSNARTNSVIVRARPRDLSEAAALIRKLDRDRAAKAQLKVIPLEFSVASDIATVLNEAIRALILPPGQSASGQQVVQQTATTGENAQALREIKSFALEFMGDDQKLIKSGALLDVRITPDPTINSLIVTAPKDSMALIEALIHHIDHEPASIGEIKVFTLQNADATQALTMLDSLFGQAAAAGGLGGAAAATAGQGVQIAGAVNVANVLIPVRFSVDIRTNSVIVIGGADAVRVVEAILLRLDQDNVRQQQTTVIKLQNRDATVVANAVTTFIQNQLALAQVQPELISNIEYLERSVVVVPEATTNAVLVSASPRFYTQVIDMIRRLDAAPPQVIIQALIVEVQLDSTDEFGIELGLQDSILFNRGGPSMPGSANNPGFLFNTATIGNNSVRPNNLAGQALSNLSVGRTNTDLGFGGLVLSAASENISILIRALASRRNVQILSRPQIRTLDNVEASVFVGRDVPVVTNVNINSQTGQASPVTQQQPAGIQLTVRPRINPDGTVVLETATQKSAFNTAAGAGVPIFVNSDGTTINAPIRDRAEALSSVSVPNGHTVILGGMITQTDTTLTHKVPWLGDVPILGQAFRYDSSVTSRRELLIFLTPRVILNDADSEYIKQVESERMHHVESDLEEMQGPIFSVAPEEFDPELLNKQNKLYFPMQSTYQMEPSDMGQGMMTPQQMPPGQMTPQQMSPRQIPPGQVAPPPAPGPARNPTPAPNPAPSPNPTPNNGADANDAGGTIQPMGYTFPQVVETLPQRENSPPPPTKTKRKLWPFRK